MLSDTNSINDVKTALLYDFTYFDFNSNELFERAINKALFESKMNYILPQLGEHGYEELQKKNKIDLELTETYIYYAEVYFACSLVLSLVNKSEGSESLSVEGYSYSTSSAGKKLNTLKFFNEAVGYMKQAGYSVMGIRKYHDGYANDTFSSVKSTIASI